MAALAKRLARAVAWIAEEKAGPGSAARPRIPNAADVRREIAAENKRLLARKARPPPLHHPRALSLAVRRPPIFALPTQLPYAVPPRRW